MVGHFLALEEKKPTNYVKIHTNKKPLDEKVFNKYFNHEQGIFLRFFTRQELHHSK